MKDAELSDYNNELSLQSHLIYFAVHIKCDSNFETNLQQNLAGEVNA